MGEWCCLLILAAFVCAGTTEGALSGRACNDKEFACIDGCVQSSWFCSGWKTTDRPCTDLEFACEDGSACLPPERFCNGLQDCRDCSDEIHRLIPLKSNESGIPCRRFSKICLLPKNQQSKESLLCTKGAVCTDEEFACEDGSRCIPPSRFCDGEKNCEDGSDEVSVTSLRPGKPCRRDKFVCLLPRSQHSKEDVFCIKNVTCSEKEFPCADNAGCLPKRWFCDGRQDCRDGSDDKRISKKPADGFQICNGRHHFSMDPLKCEVPTNHTCPEQPFCLSNPADFLDGKCFRCLQYPYIVIPIAKVCNGVIDCPDLSDECMCKTQNRPGICEKVSWENDGDEDSQINRPAFTCQSGNGSAKILTEDVCNVRVDCADRIDEEFCNTVGERTVKYRNYTCRFDENIRSPRTVRFHLEFGSPLLA